MDAPVLPLPPAPEASPSAPPLPAAAPLVPAVLLRPAALLWLWVLPLAILLALNVQGHWLIAGNMDARQSTTAHLFGLANLLNLLTGLGLFFFTAARHRADTSAPTSPSVVGWCVSAAAVAVQVAFLWFAVSESDHIVPLSVATWIYPPQRFLFNQFAFAMLPLALGVLRLACARPVVSSSTTVAVSLWVAIAVPVFLFVLVNVLHSLRLFDQISVTILVTGFVVAGLALFIGLVRTLLVGLNKSRTFGTGTERLTIVLLALVLPLSGLLLNRGIPFPVDFQAWEVYALVVANTAALLFASFQHTRRPLLSFGLLCASFPFSLYFFIVFLPYTPLSILAIIAFGLGFLILSPTLLFVLHLHLLNQARRNPLLHPHARRLTAVGLGCFLLLPACITVRALADKTALHAALDYVYTPVLDRGERTYPASLTSLRRALDSHRSYKNGIYYPLLSDFYGWLVFDHLILPDDKLARLESTFFGAVGSKQNLDPVRNSRSDFHRDSSVRQQSRMPRAVPVPHHVDVTQLAVRTTPAGEQNTTVTLALALTNTGPAVAEYLQTLPLPASVFVSGFRLHIDGAPVPGRIFEKKTALWVYTMIRDSERRDPGLLYYRTPTELELRVFPVNPGTPTIVEIDFLVPRSLTAESLAPSTKDPATLLARLGTTLRPQLTHDAHRSFVAGGLDRQNLPAAERAPYLHLIVDRSLENHYPSTLPVALRTLQEKFPTARLARITLANYDVTDLVPVLTPVTELLARPTTNLAHRLPPAGGLALDLVLARAVRQHRDTDLDHAKSSGTPPPRPIFVILSRHAAPRPVELDRTAEWLDLLPSLELHELGADATFVSHLSPPAVTTPLLRLGNSLRPLLPERAVRFDLTTTPCTLEYWAPATSTWLPVTDLTTQPATTPWSRAAALQLRQQDYARSPGSAGFDLKTLVAASRETGLLLAATSYIVVENSAQWRILEHSERQKLGQNTALAFRETPAPPALWLTLAFALWLFLRRLRRTRPAHTSGKLILPTIAPSP